MTSYIVLYNPNDDIVSNTSPSDRNHILTKEALKMILSPTTLIQPIEHGGGWLVRMDMTGDTNYLCLVTCSNIFYRGKSNFDDIRRAAENLLYWVPSSETQWLKVTVDDDLLNRA